ncbi:MAG: YbjN domain-containing protein [Micropepsaceae bacterium]
MRFLTTAMLALAFALPAAAQEPAPTPEAAPRTEPPSTIGTEPVEPPPVDPAVQQMLASSYEGLTIDELEAMLKADNYGVERFEGTNGPYLQTATANGVSYEVWLSECDQATRRCIGLTAQTFYFRESPKVTLKALNDWNQNTWAMRAVLFSDGQSAVIMNVGVNGGVTGNWVIKRFRNFNYWAEAYNAFWETGNPRAEPPG